MYPEICTIGPLHIYSYGLMLAIAFFVSVSLIVIKAKQLNFPSETVYNLCFWALLSGVIGARLFYVLENPGYYFRSPLEMIMLQRGGLSWFGGLALGLLFTFIYIRRKRLSFSAVLDLVAPFLALAQSIGRIGCFLNGCCFGKAGIFIPVQLLSSFLLVVIFIILRLLQDSRHKTGEVFFAYLLLYSLKRFFMEFLRADNSIIFSGLTLFQLISIAVFCLALWKFLSLRLSNK